MSAVAAIAATNGRTLEALQQRRRPGSGHRSSTVEGDGAVVNSQLVPTGEYVYQVFFLRAQVRLDGLTSDEINP